MLKIALGGKEVRGAGGGGGKAPFVLKINKQRELTIGRKTSHEPNNQDLPELPTVTLTWHASKYKLPNFTRKVRCRFVLAYDCRHCPYWRTSSSRPLSLWPSLYHCWQYLTVHTDTFFTPPPTPTSPLPPPLIPPPGYLLLSLGVVR